MGGHSPKSPNLARPHPGSDGLPLSQFRAGAMAKVLGPELAVLSDGLAVLGVVSFVGIAIPLVRRFTIEPGATAAEDAKAGVQ